MFQIDWQLRSERKTNVTHSIEFPGESRSNAVRKVIAEFEPVSLRTFTPSQAVLAKSAGVFHWTPEGRKLYDFSSGVLVANLGHNPAAWMQRFVGHMGWSETPWARSRDDYFTALPLTAYNAFTPIESQASKRLADLL